MNVSKVIRITGTVADYGQTALYVGKGIESVVNPVVWKAVCVKVLT